MTEVSPSRGEDMHQTALSANGVFDITSIESEPEGTFESLDRERLHRMTAEVKAGGDIDLTLERLAQIKALAEMQLEKLRVDANPLIELQENCEKDVAEIVRRIGEAGVSTRNPQGSESEIAVLAHNLISVNKQLTEVSTTVATFKSTEAKLITRIQHCDQAVCDIEKYRTGCLEDLAAAKQLNSSMHQKPGLHLLVPASLLSESERDMLVPNSYSHLLGQVAASRIVEYQVSTAIGSQLLNRSDNHTDPPKQIRESLSPAPLEFGQRQSIFKRRINNQ